MFWHIGIVLYIIVGCIVFATALIYDDMADREPEPFIALITGALWPLAIVAIFSIAVGYLIAKKIVRAMGE